MYDLLTQILLAGSLTIILYPLMSCKKRAPKSETSHPVEHGEPHTSSSESGKATTHHKSEEKPEKSGRKPDKPNLPTLEKKEHEEQKPPAAVQQPQQPAVAEVKQGGDDAGYETCPDMTPTQLAKVLAEMK